MVVSVGPDPEPHPQKSNSTPISAAHTDGVPGTANFKEGGTPLTGKPEFPFPNPTLHEEQPRISIRYKLSFLLANASESDPAAMAMIPMVDFAGPFEAIKKTPSLRLGL